MIEVKRITTENKEALGLKNDPFLNTGKLIPVFDGKNWDYRLERFPEERITTDCFPDEHYVFEEMGDNFYGLAAYVDGVCAGFALFFDEFGKYLYLDNLLVSKVYRRAGVGTALVNAGLDLAKETGKIGIRLVCQDNNLQAAEFYLKTGFELGGIDSKVYDGTKQEGKTDLFFYRRA